MSFAAKIFWHNEAQEEQEAQEQYPGPQLVGWQPLTMASLEPECYADVQACAAKLKKGEAVFVSYARLSPEDSAHYSDFMNGICYAIDAEVTAISGEILLYTPSSVGVARK